MLGFWAVAMRLVFCASSGDKDNPSTAPMAARATVIFPIRFVMSVIAFCKAQFDSRKQVEFKKADTAKTPFFNSSITCAGVRPSRCFFCERVAQADGKLHKRRHQWRTNIASAERCTEKTAPIQRRVIHDVRHPLHCFLRVKWSALVAFLNGSILRFVPSLCCRNRNPHIVRSQDLGI